MRSSYQAPQHFFNFLPLPQGQGSLRPTFGTPPATGASLAACTPWRIA